MPLNTTKAPWATQAWSKRERLTALASFVTDFSDPEFTFGEWAGGGEKDGVLIMPWFNCSPTASRFLKVLYDYGFVRDFDWPTWSRSREAEALREDPGAVAEACEDQLARLLTSIARADRFIDGTLAAAFQSGLLLHIVQRAKTLAESTAADPF